ncbi:hypothetical protein HMPREF3213_00666 [Heyndrickxia coagulans]|uniref:Uncharacterized protein n=1 Tax=Heyndrickxia coagulans TaxID=1398 RepID=A0A133KZ12_HEYCO|nr:hypothetical protein HMPREF3213_00666 [Heyndrickxia coagulans]
MLQIAAHACLAFVLTDIQAATNTCINIAVLLPAVKIGIMHGCSGLI